MRSHIGYMHVGKPAQPPAHARNLRKTRSSRVGLLFRAVKSNSTLITALVGALATITAAVIGAVFLLQSTASAKEGTTQNTVYEQTVKQQMDEQDRLDAKTQAYFDDVEKLVLDKAQPLLESQPTDSANAIARAKTQTILAELDSAQASQSANQYKADIVLFLNSTTLLKSDHPILSLAGAPLRGALLKQANLTNANLSEADLEEADLHEASLSKSILDGANLRNANLHNANLSGSTPSHAASLGHADLSGADLSGAHLDGVDLSGTLLNRAILKDSTVTPEQLDTTGSLKGATLPDGSVHD